MSDCEPGHVQGEIHTPAEERAHCITHGIGAGLSVLGLAILVTLAALEGGTREVITVAVFGVCLVLVYLSSTLYHACSDRQRKAKLQVLDHAAIYALIAGSYTPFLVVLVGGGWGWSLFGVLWGMAAIGIVFKLQCVGRINRRLDVISTSLYLLMGWLGIFFAGPLMRTIPEGALWLLVAGGLAYTVGVVFYLWERLPFNHAIWHVAVMAGSTLHFLAVLRHVVPG